MKLMGQEFQKPRFQPTTVAMPPFLETKHLPLVERTAASCICLIIAVLSMAQADLQEAVILTVMFNWNNKNKW